MNSLFATLGEELTTKDNSQSSYIARLENNAITILDDKIKNKIEKTKLSPSMIGTFLTSPGDWVMGKFIEEQVKNGYTPHLDRGNWFHSIMEAFFKLEPSKRDYQSLKKCVQNVSKDAKYIHLLKDEEFSTENKIWLKKAIEAYKDTWLDNAKNEKIAMLSIGKGKVQPGLEWFVNGKLGNTDRECLGFIDKLVEGEQGLIVQDWKTGSKIDNYNPSRPISNSNSFSYWRQQLLYTMLLEQEGIIVESASLIFPMASIPTIVEVDVNNQEAREQVIKDIEETSRLLDKCISNNFTFPFHKGVFCGWATLLCGLGSAYTPKVDLNKLSTLIEGI